MAEHTGRRSTPSAERRWRLVLGSASEEGANEGQGAGDGSMRLSDRDTAIDQALAALYDAKPESGKRSAGLAGSAPSVHRWLGDIRTYFPTPVVQVLQRDAMDRLGLRQLLFEPEMLAAVQPDVHLVGTLLSLRSAMPEQTRQTAQDRGRQGRRADRAPARTPSCTGPSWAPSTAPRATAVPACPTLTGRPRSGPT